MSRLTALISRIWKWLLPFLLYTAPPPPERRDPPDAMGWFPLLSVVGAVGLCVIAVANTGARAETGWSVPLFYIGLVILYVPIAFRLCMQEVSRRERLWLVILLAMALLMTKLLHSPTGLTIYDELLHWRTVSNLIETEKLYEANTLLPVSAFYPGLHIPTHAIMLLTGVDLFTAVIITVAFARLLLMMVLFHLYEMIGTARIAGIGCAIYMTNQSFFIFDAQYAYQTLALAFMFTVLFAVAVRLHHREPQQHYGWSILALVAMISLTITHHVTSYFMLGFLGLWLGVYVFFRLFLRHHLPEGSHSPFWTLLIGFVLIFSWMIYVASLTIGYLVPVLSGTLRDLMQVIAREESGRQLFAADANAALLTPPLWERLSVLLSICVILGGVLVGLWFIWHYHRYKLNFIVMGLIAIGFPATQAFRFTERGPELTGRFAPSLFLGVGFVIAVGVHYTWHHTRMFPLVRYAVTAALIIAFVGGGVNLSYLRWGRQPGTYLPATESRSIDPEGIEAARWSRVNWGEHNYIAADRIQGLLFSTYGMQNQVTVSFYNIFIPAMFTALQWTPEEDKILCESNLDYLVIDRRLTTGIPRVGFYFESGEPRIGHDRSQPLPAETLDKFDRLVNVSRIFDSGSIVLYDVRGYPCVE